ncbi:hypothetical protein CEXT_322261 [Caerostris extrusa]|uniref:Uncharacterized protein n=1 Tax=Caerostris extrusa TaxID=172846 RepID=A0AAV4MYK4_CAEEX|nr:hypothetical protein CEXT_322261 [Caerostris extrusa]
MCSNRITLSEKTIGPLLQTRLQSSYCGTKHKNNVFSPLGLARILFGEDHVFLNTKSSPFQKEKSFSLEYDSRRIGFFAISDVLKRVRKHPFSTRDFA